MSIGVVALICFGILTFLYGSVTLFRIFYYRKFKAAAKNLKLLLGSFFTATGIISMILAYLLYHVHISTSEIFVVGVIWRVLVFVLSPLSGKIAINKVNRGQRFHEQGELDKALYHYDVALP